ncbi:MAG: hypothetical protein ACRDRL_08315 [Sciscionella sp.]
MNTVLWRKISDIDDADGSRIDHPIGGGAELGISQFPQYHPTVACICDFGR